MAKKESKAGSSHFFGVRSGAAFTSQSAPLAAFCCDTERVERWTL